MRYDQIDPRRIAANPWNTNVVSHENEEKLKASLERHGFFRPIVVRELEDGSLQSLGGKHRAEQAIELGLDTVPVMNLGPVSDERAKEISLLDNARYGTDDALKLAELIRGLDDVDLSTFMPFSAADLTNFTASLGVRVEDLDLDEDPVMPGDLAPDDEPLPASTKPAKTHEILRLKVSLTDAARARAIIGQVMRTQGFTEEDDMTNAGDAFMHLIAKEASDDAAT